LFFSSPKFWVGLFGIFFKPNFRKPFLDSGRRSIAGPAWKLTTKIQVLSPSHHENCEEASGSVPLAVRSTPGPTGNQEEAQEELSSPHSASNLSSPALHFFFNFKLFTYQYFLFRY